MNLPNFIVILFISFLAFIYLYSLFGDKIKKIKERSIQKKELHDIEERRKIFNELKLVNLEFVDLNNYPEVKATLDQNINHNRIAVRGIIKNISDKYIGGSMCQLRIKHNNSILIIWPESNLFRKKRVKPIEPYAQQEFFHLLFKDDLSNINSPLSFNDLEVYYLDYKKFNSFEEYKKYNEEIKE